MANINFLNKFTWSERELKIMLFASIIIIVALFAVVDRRYQALKGKVADFQTQIANINNENDMRAAANRFFHSVNK